MTVRPLRALITGTTTGIGRALSQQLLAAGHDVIAINRPSAQEPAGQQGNHGIRIDITDRAAVSDVLAGLKTNDRLPDVFFLNAAINKPDNAPRFDLDVYDEVLNTNLRGTMTFIAAAAKLKLTGRTFVGFSSTSNIIPNPEYIGYSVSKSAIAQAFGMLRRTDSGNIYKIAILGPVKSDILRYSPPHSGLKKNLFNALAASSDEAATRLRHFAVSRSHTLYYRPAAVLFYVVARLALVAAPGAYRPGHRER